jgi:hypothetical protein
MDGALDKLDKPTVKGSEMKRWYDWMLGMFEGTQVTTLKEFFAPNMKFGYDGRPVENPFTKDEFIKARLARDFMDGTISKADIEKMGKDVVGRDYGALYEEDLGWLVKKGALVEEGDTYRLTPRGRTMLSLSR